MPPVGPVAGGMSRTVVRDLDGKSVASQWRRAERHDRTDAQTIIDERFERLAIEYDSEEDDMAVRTGRSYSARDRAACWLLGRVSHRV